jgi:hypothetical protein
MVVFQESLNHELDTAAWHWKHYVINTAAARPDHDAFSGLNGHFFERRKWKLPKPMTALSNHYAKSG